MSENLKKFLEFIGNDPELAEKAKQFNAENSKKTKNAAKEFAKENGFILTDTDFEVPDGELSEEELSGLSGGAYCFCAAGGGGKEGGNDGVCACVGYGQGNIVDHPTTTGSNDPLCGFGGRIRCSCLLMGSGYEAEEVAGSGGGMPLL